jgi:hypothetical protein
MAKEVLGWTPKVPLEAGLRRTIEYFESLLQTGQIERPVLQDAAQ